MQNCYRLITCLLLFTASFLYCAEQTATSSFLEVLASAEADNWDSTYKQLVDQFPEVVQEASLNKTLNVLKTTILKSGDVKLYQLLHRAVRNYDTLMPQQKAEPVPTYYAHYRPPAFLTPEIELTLRIEETNVKVRTHLKVERHENEQALILDGRNHKVFRILINDKEIPRASYKVTPHELIISNIPDTPQFTVTVESEIDPFTNKSFEGLYLCDNWLISQCESEGARRIFFTLDRPDNLSRITTTIIADKGKYPHCLSNGDLIEEKELDKGLKSVTWQDPIPKPSYLFAVVLGNFALVQDQFTTRSGRRVDLQVYVEPGKESKASYSIYALKKAMEFDEVFFDREYDLSCLKMVSVPSFNAGGMENKGLIIFNDQFFLVDSEAGQDEDFRNVAHVVSHEYFHNWSGNRVTVRNWFELALKEAFTDMRAIQFCEWLFGTEFIRPKEVAKLWDHQFTEEASEQGHPLIVDSYISSGSIYDLTTYVKGREVFRTLQTYLDMLVQDGFRRAQNLYFDQNDGKAVSFKELLAAADSILQEAGQDTSQFERWFHQQGTPIVQCEMQYDAEKKVAEFQITQSCINPRNGTEQQSFIIPFSLELISSTGETLHPRQNVILSDKITRLELPSAEPPVPIFMHGYSAPVIFKYEYSPEDYSNIIKFCQDPFIRWNAGLQHAISEIQSAVDHVKKSENFSFKEPQLYYDALSSENLNLLAKAQLLQFPSLRALADKLHYYNFPVLALLREQYIKKIACFCQPILENLLNENPEPDEASFEPKDMQIRELRIACLALLAKIDSAYLEKVYEVFKSTTNFNNYMASFNILINIHPSNRHEIINDFYKKWKHDKGIFNHWLASLASFHECTVDNLRWMEQIEGYDAQNPNHIRSVTKTFIHNLRCYHDPQGEGYQYVVDKILEVATSNPMLAYNYLARYAFEDFENLPPPQKLLMAKQIERLLEPSVPNQLRELAKALLHL